MKVMVIVKASASSEAGQLPGAELLAAMGKFNEELTKAGIMLAGEGLHPSSKGARVRFSGADRLVIDGPFAETKELIAGFWMWRVKSMAEAIEWVKRCPNPMPEESEIEIRPVFEAEDFGAEFTPELREQEAAIRAAAAGFQSVRFADEPARRIAGIAKRYAAGAIGDIPDQWRQFAPRIGGIPGERPGNAFGVCGIPADDGSCEYLTGVEIDDQTALASDLSEVRLPASRYVVFIHNGHVSQLDNAWKRIWKEWAPDCGLRLARRPCFERYSSEFNPATGTGGMELWVPLDALD